MEEDINKICNKIYEGEDWQLMIDFIKKNFIPISLIEKEIEEYEEIGMIGVADCMKRLLDERNNTDE